MDPLDLLFTPRCIFCQRILGAGSREKLCPCCHPADYRIRGPRCVRCGRSVPREGMLCQSCLLHHRELNGRAPFRYEGKLREALHRLKYGGQRDYADFFGGELWRLEKAFILDFAPDALVPVPLHPSRLRERGYNQARFIALALGRYSGIPVWELLERSRRTDAQKGLSSLLRRQNLSGAFRAIPAEEWPCPPEGSGRPLRLLLIDDIYTTGSTVQACAGALEKVCPGLGIRFLAVALTPPPHEKSACESSPNLL